MLSRILVPTDFSVCANDAADMAVAIAAKANASIHFFHSAAVHPFWDELSDEERSAFPVSFAEAHDMDDRFDSLLGKYQHADLPMETSYAAGNLLTSARKLIDQEGMNLVVMGSHGASGMQEIVFGSNAQRLVRHAHCPVMVLKKPAKATMKKIVFASDFKEEAIPAFEWMVMFAKIMEAELLLLHILPEARFMDKVNIPPPDFEAFLARTGSLKVSTQAYSDLDIEHGITNFANRVDADLVALAHYERPFLERMLVGSLTEALVNHLEIPVLSINQ